MEMKTRKYATAGDAAVDGLIQGLLAGALMLIYLVVIGWSRGWAFSDTLGLFATDAAAGLFLGGLAHLAVSGIYGAAFSLVFRRLRGSVWALAAGFGYGLFLIVIATYVLIPGSGSSLASVETVHFITAHLVYGLTLGGLTFRSVR